MAKGQRFSEEEKRAILKETKNSTVQEVANKHGIHYSTIYDWGKKKAKRRMTKPKSKTIISNGELTEPRIEITTKTIRVVPIGVVEELKDELAFWKNYALKLIREKESQ